MVALAVLAVAGVAATSYNMYRTAASAVSEDLDRRIIQAAREAARVTQDSLQRYPAPQWSPDERLRLNAQLESIRLASELETLFIFDANRRCIVDARPRVRVGKQYTFLELPTPAAENVRNGKDWLEHRPAPGGLRFRSIAIPVDENSEAGVYARASIEFEDSLMALRNRWIAATALSVGVTAALVGVLVVLYRRSRRLHEAMQRQSRLAMVHQLSAGIAHDMKGPLTVMRFAVSEVKDPAYAAPMKTLRDGITQLVDILGNLLGTGKDMKPERIELEPLLSSLVRQLLPAAAEKGVALSVEFPKGRFVCVPATSLRMALANLIHNAIDAVPESTGRITIGSRVDKRTVGIAISDNGPGIPQAMQKTLFDPLVTSKDEGSGLGLPVTRQLLEDMHGRLEFESESGAGSTFIAWLPLDE